MQEKGLFIAFIEYLYLYYSIQDGNIKENACFIHFLTRCLFTFKRCHLKLGLLEEKEEGKRLLTL